MGAPMQPCSPRHRRSAAVVAFAGSVAAAIAAPGVARAQPAPTQLGFSIDRFNPSERGSEWFALDSLDLRGNVRPAAGAVLEWAHNPLVIQDANGNNVGSVVSDQVFLHAGTSLVLIDALRLGIDIPIGLAESGNDASVGGAFFPAPTRASTGDFRASADLRVWGHYGEPFTAAVGLSLFMPSGEPREYTGDGIARGEPHALVAGDVPISPGMSVAYAARLGFMIRGLNESFGGVNINHELDYGVSAGVRMLD